MLYYTIPVTDGDTAPSSSQMSSTTSQDTVKTSSPVVGKCMVLAHQVFTTDNCVTVLYILACY